MAQDMKAKGQGKQKPVNQGSEQQRMIGQQPQDTSPDGVPVGVSHHPVGASQQGSFGNTGPAIKGEGTEHLGNQDQGGLDHDMSQGRMGGQNVSNQPRQMDQ